MNNHISITQVIDRLTEQDIPHVVQELQGGVCIVLCQHGGRVFGPFLPGESESILWMNAAFAHRQAFDDFLHSGDWNLGGDRLWIGPEIQYCICERGLNGEPCREIVQTQIDPGSYVLNEVASGGWRLRQEMTLDTYNLSSTKKTFSLERVVRPAQNPLAAVSSFREMMDGVIYAGYQHRVTFSEDTTDDTLSNVWALIQLNPGGSILTPTTSNVEYVDYYEAVDAGVHAVFPDYAVARITGDRQYKLGYKATHVWGRMGYFCPLAGDKHYLLIRNFQNNPSGFYLDEPAHLPGAIGASTFIYNDDGGIGGFGELEYQARAIGGPAGTSAITDVSSLWLFVGEKGKLTKVANQLLGLDLP